MEFIKHWITQIAYISVLSIVLELLIPSSGLKKYARVIIGLIIMITIINPVIDFIKGNYNFDAMVFKNNYYMNRSDIESLSKEAEKQRYMLISKEYKRRLVEQIKSRILNTYEVDNVNVVVNIIEDINSKDFGKINSIYISFKYPKTKSGNSTNVNKVNINSSNNDKIPIDYNDIKKIISTFYNVPFKNITIEEK